MAVSFDKSRLPSRHSTQGPERAPQRALMYAAGVPEGGMLSMRQSRRGTVEFYSADERLTSEETRQVLLEPLLFPKQSSAA